MRTVKGHRYLYRRGGSFVFRRGVPKYASVDFDGKTEAFDTLDAKSLEEAKYEILGAIKRFDRRIAAAKRRSRTASDDADAKILPSMVEIDESVRAWFTQRLEKGNLEALRRSGDVKAAQTREAELMVYAATLQRNLALGGDDNDVNGHWISQTLIERHRWAVEEGTPDYQRLLRTVRRGQLQSAKMELQELRGEPRRIEDETFSIEQFRLDNERQRIAVIKPVSIYDLFEGYIQENKLRPATVTAWRRQVGVLVNFLGHDNAREIEHEHLVAWKENLLQQRTRTGSLLNTRTVRDTYFAAIKAVFRWAKSNAKIDVNPTADIQIRVTKKKRKREEVGFTDAEAITILRATMEPPPKKLSPERAFARRWVPWLCAYTGARIREMTQIRREDIFFENGFWAVNITPEAGSVKTDEPRIVPLHPHLVEQGFISAIAEKSGPLFYNPKRRLKADPEQSSQSRKVADYLAIWVRAIGVNDRAVQPNHGWRHRFKTLTRRHRMDARISDFIQGHAPRTDGEGYGNTDVLLKFEEIQKLPPYDVRLPVA